MQPLIESKLYLRAYQVTFRVLKHTRLPSFPLDRVKVLRGAFHSALAFSYCSFPNEEGHFCQSCNCQYGELAGVVQAPAFSSRTNLQCPPAFLLWLDRQQGRVEEGEEFRFGITLFGVWSDRINWLLPAINLMAKKFLGREEGTYSLDKVDEVDAFRKSFDKQKAPIGIRSYPNMEVGVSRLELKFDPMVVLSKTNSDWNEIKAGQIISSLFRRLVLTEAAYCGGDLPENWDGLDSFIGDVQVTRSHLLPTQWRKKDSGRFGRKQGHPNARYVNGMMGSLELEGKGLADLLPLLRLGQWLRLGKMTVYGMGEYELIVD